MVKIQGRFSEMFNSISIFICRKIHTTTCLHSYCTICGKIGDKLKDSIVKDYIRSELHNRKTIYSVMSGTELYEKYHDKLPVFFVDDIFKEKYIDLEQNDNSNGE